MRLFWDERVADFFQFQACLLPVLHTPHWEVAACTVLMHLSERNATVGNHTVSICELWSLIELQLMFSLCGKSTD